MAGLRVRVDVDLAGILRSLDSAEAGAALELLTRTVEQDMRPYVKHDTGQLEDSASLNSDFAGGRIVYTAVDSRGTDYAGYAYEDPNVAATDPNPKATANWAEACAADRRGEWERLLGSEIERGAS